VWIRKFLGGWRKKLGEGLRGRLEKQGFDEVFHGREDIAENDQADENAGKGKGAGADPVKIAAGAVFRHQQHDHGTAVERRDGEKIKDA